MLFLNNKMAEFSKYVFDMIVVKILVPSGDPCQAKVECDYRDRTWTVPPNRINVSEFPDEGGIEIIEPLESLLQSLQNEDFVMTVSDGGKVLADLEFKLPAYLYHNVKTLNDGFYFVRFQLNKDNDTEAKPACIEVMFRMTPCCNTLNARTFPDPTCPNLRNKIKPEDVLFLVGEPNKVFPYPDKNPFFKDENAFENLNLKKLKLYHGSEVGKIPDLPNAQCSINCECFQKNEAQLQRPSMRASQQMGQSSGQAWVTGNCFQLPLPESEDDDDDTDDDDDDQFERESYDEEVFSTHEPKKQDYNIPVPSYEFIKSLKSRCCPICSYELKYLPALATCPRCCFKPEPTGVKEPKPKKIKSKHICFDEDEDEVRKSLCSDDLPQVRSETTCGCTCTPGWVCPYCRVRRACKIDSNKFVIIQKAREDNMCRSALDLQEDDQTSSTIDSKPHLAAIFSELEALYNLKEMKCKSETEKETVRERAGIDCRKEGTIIKEKEDLSLKLERSKPSKDIKKIRKDMKNQKVFKKEMTLKKKKKRSKFNLRARKSRKPKCGQCNPLGCLPCVKHSKNKCGNKYFDYCSIRGASAPRRDDHGFCNSPKSKVPCSMGWLWNRHKPHRGWKPGYIATKVKNLMGYFLEDFPTDTLPVSRYCHYPLPKSPKLEKVDQQITLEVEKKNKDYLITFRPLKDRETLKTAVDPFVPMKPIQVRITEDPLQTRIRSVKKCMFVKGFRKCICKQPAVRCCCRTLAEKNFMLQELQQLCQKYKVENGWQSIVLDDDNDGDNENDEYCFGVTPPAGIIKYHKFDRPDYREATTQYNSSDFVSIPLFKKPDKDAAAGKKRKKTEGGKGRAIRRPPKPAEKGAGGDGPSPAPAPGSPEARKAALLERMANNKKLSELVGSDGKLDMKAYLNINPILKGAAAAVARARRLRLLSEQIPLPFELYAKRAFNTCFPCHLCCAC